MSMPIEATPNMATTLVASNVMPQPVTKRYRPAPAKTFQCRGYGECRMVFSRSEHLARHVRKHTGERPFTCHCSKQFSRLDNLRQHAQTVHADKQDQNERMMRDLTSLHASMAAANKAHQARGGRRVPKQEPVDARPGTSTGYEGVWHVDTSHSFRDQQQSFREQPGQSFRQSFLSLNSTGITTTANSLPPLAQIVPGSSRGLHRPGTAPEPTSYAGLEPSPESPIGGFYDSPFSFHPPPNATEPPAVPRKRAFGSPNGPAPDDSTPNSVAYDYGTDSRPQSRRLSVLELCNDRDDGPLLAGGPASRPNTSSGLVSSAKALALVDREQLEYRSEYASPHTESSSFVVEPTAGASHGVRTGTDETATRPIEESAGEERGRGIFELPRISSATGDGSGSGVLSSSSRTIPAPSTSVTSTVNSFAYTSSLSGGDVSSATSSGTSSSASSPISPRTSPAPNTKSSSPIHFSAPGFTARVGLSSDANYLSRHAPHITDQVRGARYGDVVVGMRI